MKSKLFISTILVVALFLPAVTFGAFENNLFYGSRGDAVTELQKFLTKEGTYSGPVTGNFFSLTLEAVKSFQEKEGIVPVAGYFGPKTRAAANSKLAPATSTPKNLTEQINALLKQVRELQKQLSLLEQQSVTSTQVSVPVSVATSTATSTTTQQSLPGVVIEAVSPVFGAPTPIVGTGSGVTVGVFKVTNSGDSAVYLSSLKFSKGGVATTSLSFSLFVSIGGGSSADASVLYGDAVTGTTGASPTVLFIISGISETNRLINSGSWRYLTIKTKGVTDNNDTFQFGVNALGDVTYSAY
ncbi:MAG: peptidoglycan-binding domain-containing protein [Candidatus Jorgensenbacteria bacterium]|nr:peptidoglycan-binding domain-containing protein [Candidatus Jorgensenbacteria bacterium]